MRKCRQGLAGTADLDEVDVKHSALNQSTLHMKETMADRSGLGLSPAQAVYVVDRLVRDKRISPARVRAIAADMVAEVREIERRLALLRGVSAPVWDRDRSRVRKPRRAVSAETAASRQIQGQYLGLIRQIPATQRGRFKKVAREKGREAAIRQLRVALAARRA